MALALRQQYAARGSAERSRMASSTFTSRSPKTPDVSDQRKRTQRLAPQAPMPEWRIQNFTCGAVREPSLAWKYALFWWNPAKFAQMLFGNCPMKVL